MEPSPHDQEKIEQLRRVMYSRRLSEQLHNRPRRELHPDREIVGDDWHKDEPQLSGMQVAPRMIGTTRAVLKWFLMISLLFFFGALGFFGYYFTLGGGSHPANPGNIDIAISGPPQVAGGEPVELQITVVNRNRVPLELADLLVKFPAGTRSVADFATDLRSLRQSLGTIEPGGRRQGTISAVFAGAVTSTSTVNVELEYRVQGSNAIFVAARDYALTFTSSPLSISVEGNAQTTSGQPVQFTVNVASNASAPLKDVVLDVTYPFGFKMTSASPAPKVGSTWSLGDFAPGQTKSILVQGTLAGEPGDKRIFRLAAGTRTSTSTGVSARLADNTYEMQIAQAFLGLSVRTSETGSENIVTPGETVTVVIDYKNNLTSEITDAVIVARLSGILVDGETVRAAEGFYRSSDDTVLWDKTSTGGDLARIKPGQQGQVAFSFKMPDGASYQNGTNPRIDVSVNAAAKRLSESGVPQSLQSTARGVVKLASDVTLVAQALYQQNPFGIMGPKPPKAGEETGYAIVFTITNTANRVSGAKLTATLPPYVRWVGSHAPKSEKLTFNQYDGTFTWDLGDIEPGAGQDGTKPRQIAISVALTPSTSQIGEQPVLMQNVHLTGEDSNGKAIDKRAEPDVSTNLSRIGISGNGVTANPDAGFEPGDATVVK